MLNKNSQVYLRVPLKIENMDPEELRKERMRQRENWSDWLPQSASLRNDSYHSGGDLFRDEYPDPERMEDWDEFDDNELQIGKN